MIIYGILTLGLVVALILFREWARRIFWAWVVVLAALSAHDYFKIESEKAAVRAVLHESFALWAGIDVTSLEAQASFRNAGRLAENYPLHWCEGSWEKMMLIHGVANQMMLALNVYKDALERIAAERARENARAAERRAEEDRHRTAEEKAARGWRTILVDSEPAGAKVFVEGIEMGITPQEVEAVPGSYSITVRKDGFDWWSEKVVVWPGSSPKIMVRLVARPKISSAEVSQR